VPETKQYIQFILGQENLAVEMGYVREIIKPLEIRKLLGCPTFVLGVCKVRDEIVTIIDLHKKFCISTTDQTK
jgi:purine-binding chemotaxis protein CheW